MKVGLKSYFEKYAFKNTELNDFLVELGKAAKKQGIKDDLVQWSYTWLKTSGINIITSNYTEENGKITHFSLKQNVHKYGHNRLRK